MDYEKVYNEIVSSAKVRGTGDEKHHIIPRCIGGTDDEDNLVLLTYREHYICHYLLTKFNSSRQLKNAFFMMSMKNTKKYYNSYFYELAKREYSDRISGDGHWAKEDEFRQLISDTWTEERKKTHKEKIGGDNHYLRKDPSAAHERARRMRAALTPEIQRRVGQMNGRASAREVIIDGVHYPSRKEARKKLGLCTTVFYRKYRKELGLSCK